MKQLLVFCVFASLVIGCAGTSANGTTGDDQNVTAGGDHALKKVVRGGLFNPSCTPGTPGPPSLGGSGVVNGRFEVEIEVPNVKDPGTKVIVHHGVHATVPEDKSFANVMDSEAQLVRVADSGTQNLAIYKATFTVESLLVVHGPFNSDRLDFAIKVSSGDGTFWDNDGREFGFYGASYGQIQVSALACGADAAELKELAISNH
jgi:hypothetical protein